MILSFILFQWNFHIILYHFSSSGGTSSFKSTVSLPKKYFIIFRIAITRGSNQLFICFNWFLFWFRVIVLLVDGNSYRLLLLLYRCYIFMHFQWIETQIFILISEYSITAAWLLLIFLRVHDLKMLFDRGCTFNLSLSTWAIILCTPHQCFYAIFINVVKTVIVVAVFDSTRINSVEIFFIENL